MSDGVPYADILILALIAGFILLRLRSVLGDKMGNDNPDFFQRPVMSASEKQEPIIQLDERSQKPKPREELDPYLLSLSAGEVATALNAIKAKDPQFTATHFLQGAKAAFEMIFDAFAKGDRQTLKMLLSDEIFQHFSNDITTLESAENKTEHTLVSAKALNIMQASINGSVARLTVHFSSEQMTVVRDKSGVVVEGNPSDIVQVEDHWTFERDTSSKNPNWKVIET